MKPKMIAKICVDIGMTAALLLLMPLHLGLHWSMMMDMAVMGLFVWIGYYLAEILKRCGRKRYKL